jgi:hypothetical protein
LRFAISRTSARHAASPRSGSLFASFIGYRPRIDANWWAAYALLVEQRPTPGVGTFGQVAAKRRG